MNTSFFVLVLLTGQLALASIMDANWVSRDYEKRTGVLEYLDQGANPVREKRRRDAMAKMAEFCQPNSYKILKEAAGTKQYGEDYQPAGTYGSIVSDGKSFKMVFTQTAGNNSFPIHMNYNYIGFRCTK